MANSSEHLPPKASTSRWKVALVVATVLVVAALLVQRLLIQPAREAAFRTSCKGQLKIFGLALHNYHDNYGSFPPAYLAAQDGRPMHSWRVLSLTFMGEQALHDQYRFSEMWNSPHNSTLADGLPIGMSGIVPMYHCGSDRDSDWLDT